MTTLLQTLYSYHAWANEELLDKLQTLDRDKHGAELQSALSLISHYYVVSRIFAAHLKGVPHGYVSDTLDETPTLEEMGGALASSDRWYLDYIRDASPAALAEPVSFTFTDGDKGCMSRQEILLHVALHATIHRGEVCRILSQLSITPPWETLAVHLHRAEPTRRMQSGLVAA